MKRTVCRRAIIIWIAAWLLTPLLSSTPRVYAQTTPADEAQPFVTITGVDATAFPEIKVTIYGENLGVDLAALSVTLREDTEEHPTQNLGLQEIGVQTAFALDASSDPSDDILGPGNSGRPRIEEFRTAIETLIDSRGVLVPETDWAAAFTTSDNVDKFRTITDWTQDHGALRNDVLLYSPAGDIPRNTSLFELLTFVLDRFNDSRVPENTVKSIVVFSNGYDATSDLDINDAIDRARAMNVRIYTVMVGPEAPSRRSNLERIAKLTNGAYFVLRDPVTDLDQIWEALRRQRRQLVLTYQLGNIQPRELAIEAAIPNRPAIVTKHPFPVVPYKPVQIRVIEPAAGNILVRTAPAFDTPLSAIEPVTLPIRLEFTWPDNQPRDFQRVEFIINDDTRTQTVAPFDQFDFPIGELPAGNYTLRIIAIDKYGIEARSEPLPIPIQINLPPTPEPTNTPAPTPTDLPTATPMPPTATAFQPTAEPAAAPVVAAERPSLGPLPLLLLALALLLFIFLYRRWKRAREEPDDHSDIYTLRPVDDWSEKSAKNFSPADELTEIPAAMPFKPEPAAYLVAVNPAPHLPERITLHVGQVIRIGRRPDLNDVVIDDKQISRVHAIVTHKDKGFFIQDNGSTGGTYVNRRKLSASDDKLLQPGDVINLYSIAYEFQPAEDDRTETTVGDPFTMDKQRTVSTPRETPMSSKVAKEPDTTEYMAYDDQSDEDK
ncbi:MAG: FHA domain-containing protein [Caldilinea sp. CFX5]|nr:FHA domain-containing protein [Caldilinea sp. CFX5]